MENKKRFLSFKNMSRKDFGRNAIIGFLGGGIMSMSGIVIIEIIGSVLSLLGLICGVIWLYKFITHKL